MLELFDPNKLTCIDIESTSGDDAVPAFNWEQGHRIAGVAIAQIINGNYEAVYVPLRHRTEAVDFDKNYAELKKFIGACRKIINHNIKFDLGFLAADDIHIHLEAELIDTMVLARLYNCEETEFNLDYLSAKYNTKYFKEGDPVKEWCDKNKTKDYGRVPIRLMSEYAKYDVLATLELGINLWNLMTKEEYDFRPWYVEKALTRILFESELEGKPLDTDYLHKQSILRVTEMIKSANRISEICGEEFNAGSPKQVREYFQARGVHSNILTAEGNKLRKDEREDEIGPEHESFGKDTLLEICNVIDEEDDEELPHEEQLKKGSDYRSAAYWIIIHNKQAHNYNTFCKGWLEAATNKQLFVDFKQSGTRSGRLSMGKPTLHNYPEWAAHALKIPDGCIGVEWDASQIEYRLYSHFSRDPNLINAYAANPDLDFHQLQSDNTGVPRKPSKTLNFAMLYGIGVGKTVRYITRFILENDSEELRLTLRRFAPDLSLTAPMTEELVEPIAKKIRKGFLDNNPGIDRLKKEVKSGLLNRITATRPGWIKNFYGRRYHNQTKFAYKMLNYLCQGTAADWFKETMVKVFTDERIRSIGITGRNMTTNIHDSVKSWMQLSQAQTYWDVSKEHATRSIFRVPILIDGHICLGNWGNAFPILADNIELTYQVAANEEYYTQLYSTQITALCDKYNISARAALFKHIQENEL